MTLLYWTFTVIIHLIFALGVAKDIGTLNKTMSQIFLVSGFAWVLATLLGGALIGTLYWMIHHRSFGK